MVFLIHVALYTTLILVDAHPVEGEVELKLLDLVQSFQDLLVLCVKRCFAFDVSLAELFFDTVSHLFYIIFMNYYVQ